MKKPMIMTFIFVLGLAVGSQFRPSQTKPESKGRTHGTVLISHPVEGGHKIERLRLIPQHDNFGGNEWWIEIDEQVYVAVPGD